MLVVIRIRTSSGIQMMTISHHSTSEGNENRSTLEAPKRGYQNPIDVFEGRQIPYLGINGGDDGARTRDLCRDRAAL
jgi:hypothetical protein